jgi:hypothetical protein
MNLMMAPSRDITFRGLLDKSLKLEILVKSKWCTLCPTRALAR